MSGETFVFTSATLRSLRLQQELLDWDQERRALARRHRAWKRGIRDGQRSDPLPRPEPQYCRDAAVHNALFTGDLLKIKSIFRDRAMVNVIVEVASDELVWSAELGRYEPMPPVGGLPPLALPGLCFWVSCCCCRLHVSKTPVLS
ncbi:ASB16 protein, partial [Polypterus senegalus]